ncbi:methyltransferase domain-containing protein [Shimazuella sp. AN120528]|uniref:methyltransferase domain-containing protein n=1 Tax=Shimazuella soli TaxID=1892854 RepID=UPI001F10088E|nr:methyltransferase domain-containing protein [Shimazuella soli]MCH5586176.1 methyltransferase domain-containing protein [Shimazuella soli]
MAKTLFSSDVKSKTSEMMFTYGIGCHAILVLHAVGLLPIIEKRPIKKEELTKNEKFPQPMAIIGAFQALTYANIVKDEEDQYFLTEPGRDVVENIDMFIHWYNAYGNLMAKSVDIAKNLYVPSPEKDYDLDQVAYSASLIKRRLIKPVLKEIISELEPKGVLCDMGCSSGELLISLCQELELDGLGFEKSPKMVELANKNIQMNTVGNIHAYYADYISIKGVYPEVDLLICDFFMHHITDDRTCVEMLRSFKTTFPNSRYMLFMDNYTPEIGAQPAELFAPAFDFVHRLQNIDTRNYSSLEGIINNTGYDLAKRIDLDIANSYLWLLKMN